MDKQLSKINERAVPQETIERLLTERAVQESVARSSLHPGEYHLARRRIREIDAEIERLENHEQLERALYRYAWIILVALVAACSTPTGPVIAVPEDAPGHPVDEREPWNWTLTEEGS